MSYSRGCSKTDLHLVIIYVRCFFFTSSSLLLSNEMVVKCGVALRAMTGVVLWCQAGRAVSSHLGASLRLQLFHKER